MIKSDKELIDDLHILSKMRRSVDVDNRIGNYDVVDLFGNIHKYFTYAVLENGQRGEQLSTVVDNLSPTMISVLERSGFKVTDTTVKEDGTAAYPWRRYPSYHITIKDEVVEEFDILATELEQKYKEYLGGTGNV